MGFGRDASVHGWEVVPLVCSLLWEIVRKHGRGAEHRTLCNTSIVACFKAASYLVSHQLLVHFGSDSEQYCTYLGFKLIRFHDLVAVLMALSVISILKILSTMLLTIMSLRLLCFSSFNIFNRFLDGFHFSFIRHQPYEQERKEGANSLDDVKQP